MKRGLFLAVLVLFAVLFLILASGGSAEAVSGFNRRPTTVKIIECAPSPTFMPEGYCLRFYCLMGFLPPSCPPPPAYSV